MTIKPRLFPLVAVLFLTGSAFAQEPGKLFDEVARTLERRYFDQEYRTERLPYLAGLFRPLAEKADTLDEERAVIHLFLSKIPASHLALYSRTTYDSVMKELMNRKSPTFGFDLVEQEGQLFVHAILEGGPAFEAGLLRWDRIVEVDGLPVSQSPRLDWRSDDAFLPDPPIHRLLCKEGDRLSILVERRPGTHFQMTIPARPYSGFEAAKASCRIIGFKGKRFGYIHFWFIHHKGAAGLLSEMIRTEFRQCHGLLLDLRGRGGSMLEVVNIVTTLIKEWFPRPMVALVDDGTRSAKEVITYEIRKNRLGLIVGEKTAGAVIPATFKKVGRDSVLMFPSYRLGGYTKILEGEGVDPDIPALDAGPYSEGADPILEAGIVVLDKVKLRL